MNEYCVCLEHIEQHTGRELVCPDGLYEFTEPKAPEGWHGVRWLPNVEPATTFVVHD